MSLGKKDIVKDISSKARISSKTSKHILNKFIEVVITKSNYSQVKIANFGTFYNHKSPKRLGRNPKTMEKFVIPKRNKISFRVSQNVKKLIN